MEAIPTIGQKDARRLLLHAQGLFGDATRRATTPTIRRTIERLGFVQLDSIQVVARGHDLTLAARLDGYRPRHIPHLIERRQDLFEHWTHDASAIPFCWFVPWRHRCRRMATRVRRSPWFQRRLGEGGEARLEAVRDRIDREGPLMSRDFRQPGGRKESAAAWWNWKPDKAALDFLWWRGDLSVVARVHFQKVYELTDRAYPEWARAALQEEPDETTYVDWACREALERLVVADASEIAAFHAAVTRAEARRWCDAAVHTGDLIPVRVLDGRRGKPRPAYAARDWERSVARANGAFAQASDRIRLLSPFDPVIRDRARTARLFDFEYRFEAFVPAPRRRHGYYVLPLLRGDRLIGRVDLKHDREQGSLHALGLWWEPGRGRSKREQALLRGALARLARTLGAGSVRRDG